ncbi:MAG TPA: fumarate hydratase [bacterium]|nr:fumarate hydratase [bacterium]
MRTLNAATITEAVRDLSIRINHQMGSDMLAALERARAIEESEIGRSVLDRLLENARVARKDWFPICQDTGTAVIFADLGQDLHVTNGDLEGAINEGVRQGYRDGYLRASIVRGPLDRVNTQDNTPATVYYRIIPGDRLELAMLAKGAGCDNMSRLAMLTPSEGYAGAAEFVTRCISEAGPNPSPPLIVGVGLGGTFERAALLSKRALLRTVGQPHPEPSLAELEADLLRRINDLGIGPAGFGGRVTALAVHVEVHPTHIASLPVAINLDCHSHRSGRVVL